MTTTITTTPDRIASARHCFDLLHEPGDVYEIRALIPGGSGYINTASGYFNDAGQAAKWAAECDRRKASGVYVTLNPCLPALLARARNKMADRAKNTTRDAEILRRRWLFIDIDPQRPAGIPADDAERQAAQELHSDIEDALRGLGWPFPLLADSGNGKYLLYKIDLPNDDASRDLIRDCLAGINAMLPGVVPGEPFATVDTAVFNAARILRVGGTTNRKGDGTADRPHRIVEYHEQIDDCPVSVVPIELLQELAAMGKPSKPQPSANGHASNGQASKRRRAGDVSMGDKTGRCKLYLTKVRDSISGDDGSGALLRACCECWKFALDDAAAREVIDWFNTTKTGGEPWDEKAIEKKLTDSRAKVEAAREFGCRLKTSSQSNGTPADDSGGDDEPLPKIELIPSRDFAAAEYQQRYLVRRILVEGQPAIIGGRSKTLKTSLMVDMALSLGSGTQFLGEFPATQSTVALLSGESGQFTIQETALRIAKSKGISLADASVHWGFSLPQIARDGDIAALADAMGENDIDVLMIDPAYLCLLAGDTQGLQSSNVFQMGPLLLKLSELGQQTNTTVILCHHCRKNSPNEQFSVPDLEELSMSGFAEWARQWLLVGRREAYEQGSGLHRLWLNIGGSAGHSGCYAIDIDEGEPGDDFTGRRWELEVSTATDARQQAKQRKNNQRAEQQSQTEAEHKRRLLAAMRQLPGGETANVLRSLAGLSGNKFSTAIRHLHGEGRAESCKVAKGNREFDGWKPTGK